MKNIWFLTSDYFTFPSPQHGKEEKMCKCMSREKIRIGYRMDIGDKSKVKMANNRLRALNNKAPKIGA
jgi:hypothetical protein